MNPKQRAAEAAMNYVESGMVVGLGTGTTADEFLKALGKAIKAGKLTDIRGVPTSIQSERRARELEIPLVSLVEAPHPDVTIDGADEIDPNLDLIKGLGGALLREKIVAQNSAKLVIIADAGKVVEKLGTRAMLPIEIVQFSHEAHVPFIRNLGGEPTLRRAKDGAPFVTDNGNYIYDCRFADGIPDPHKVEQALRTRAGIVESGLFLSMATIAIISDDEHAEVCEREYVDDE
ncbi:ribose 5-phosphate isomerase A [Humisphaera borealis]|uniref:Ribose-5-phosphate isomerase A n=1 Tax=Humisphaera borealis TaxID=2807512 RepID=A0A7M2WX35_9BACT|nr:ribose 5-phosphate isomerase A [Humisphaera borealis]QOV89070.1 ribose 5-phosphate isomerase A [Humisphaera borealis]